MLHTKQGTDDGIEGAPFHIDVYTNTHFVHLGARVRPNAVYESMRHLVGRVVRAKVMCGR